MTWTIPIPKTDGYKLKPVDPVVRTDMEVGSSRARRRTFARNDKLEVAWRFSDADMSEFRTWFDDPAGAGGGSAWFEIPLAIGTGGAVTKEAKFAEMFEADALPGLRWDVTAKLEVR